MNNLNLTHFYLLYLGGYESPFQEQPRYGGIEVTRLLTCLLGAFSQGLRNLPQLHSWAVF